MRRKCDKHSCHQHLSDESWDMSVLNKYNLRAGKYSKQILVRKLNIHTEKKVFHSPILPKSPCDSAGRLCRLCWTPQGGGGAFGLRIRDHLSPCPRVGPSICNGPTWTWSAVLQTWDGKLEIACTGTTILLLTWTQSTFSLSPVTTPSH